MNWKTLKGYRIEDKIWLHEREIWRLSLHRFAGMRPSAHRRLERKIQRHRDKVAALKQHRSML